MVLSKEILETKGFHYDEEFKRYSRVLSEYSENGEYRCVEVNVYLRDKPIVEMINGIEMLRLFCSSVEKFNIMASLIGIRLC